MFQLNVFTMLSFKKSVEQFHITGGAFLSTDRENATITLC